MAVAVVAAAVTSEGFCAVEYYADSSSDSSDPELEPQDKWSCLKCKQKNQPIPRYCQQCFSVRKKWFPPRPRRRSRARRQAVREQAEQKGSTSFSEPSREVREVPGPSSMSMCETPYSPSRAGSFEFVHPTTSQPQDSLPSSPSSDRTAPDDKPDATSQSQLDGNQNLQQDIDDFLAVVKKFKPCDTENNSDSKPGSSKSPDQQSKDSQSPIHKPVATDSNTPQDSGINCSLNESFDSQADTIILSRSSSSDEDVADMSCFSAASRKSVSEKQIDNQQVDSDEDVVDFPTNRISRKSETSNVDAAPSTSVNQQVEICHSDEDVVDFPCKLVPRKTEVSNKTVISIKQESETCFSDEDVVDFPMRSTKLPSSTFKDDSATDKSKSGVSSYLKRACTTEVDEDVVDHPIKRATLSSVEDSADIPKQATKICDASSPCDDKDTVDLPSNLSNKSSFHSDIDMPCSSPNLAHDVQLENIKQDDTPSTSSPRSMPSHSSQSPSSQTSDTKMCIVCESREANTAFTHSKVAHLCVCYSCAKKIYNTKGQCPICRRAASSFYKVITI
ncbi:hypothetical protein B566_EDAN006716 [Ephemera danica]|nr:hypothetical protein B566_EDAN006716 [Ephemera danica]